VAGANRALGAGAWAEEDKEDATVPVDWWRASGLGARVEAS